MHPGLAPLTADVILRSVMIVVINASSVSGFCWEASRSPRCCPVICSIPPLRPPPRVCTPLLLVKRGYEVILIVILTGRLFLFYFQPRFPAIIESDVPFLGETSSMSRQGKMRSRSQRYWNYCSKFIREAEYQHDLIYLFVKATCKSNRQHHLILKG